LKKTSYFVFTPGINFFLV
jgi:hypothetical protein